MVSAMPCGTLVGVDEASCLPQNVSRETFVADHDCMHGCEAITAVCYESSPGE